MVVAALRERIPRSGWAGVLVKPETACRHFRPRPPGLDVGD